MKLEFNLHFLGLGPQRTASSWLDQVLRAHPQIALPHQVKETFFWDERWDKGMEWYAWHFRHRSSEQLAGEIAPTCFDHPGAREALQSAYPDLKILINVRNPIERAHSLYRHHRTKGRVPDGFDLAVEVMPRILTSGKYAEHASQWEESFPHCLYLIQEDIQNRPREILETVCAFLKVAPISLPEIGREPYGTGTSPRFPALARTAASTATWARDRRLHAPLEWGKKLGLKRVFTGGKPNPSLSAEQRKKLLAYYEQDISWLEKRLNRDFSQWREIPDAPEGNSYQQT